MQRLALILAASAFAAPAFAADIISEEPPMPAPVEYSEPSDWTGLYVGGQAGVAFGGSRGAAGVEGFPDDSGTFRSKRDTGFTGGGHVGYDRQIGNVIVGGVADFNYIDKDRRAGVVLEDGTVDDSAYSNKTKVEYFGTVRGKAGYAMDRVAVYGTGGLAYGKVKNDRSGDATFVSASGTAYDVTGDSDKDKVGYTVGAGVDVLATQNVSFGLEYLYTDLGKAKSQADFDAVSAVAAGDPADFSAETKTDVDFHSVMAKASYRFK